MTDGSHSLLTSSDSFERTEEPTTTLGMSSGNKVNRPDHVASPAMTGTVRCCKHEQTADQAPTSFLSLARELRNKIYELSLVQEDEIDPWRDYRHEYTSGLLLASKTVHREAIPVFYGRNRFDFSVATPEQVGSFLEKIGKTNASHIRDILINFPDVLCLDRYEVSLERDTMSILDVVRRASDDLRTITTSRDSTDNVERKLDSLDNLKVASEALALVDARLRSIPSIQEIIVEVYEDAPSDRIRKTMESHGWVLRRMEFEEEEEEDWGRDISDFDEDDRDYRYDSDGDDYDIDNDSDFWRRAAD